MMMKRNINNNKKDERKEHVRQTYARSTCTHIYIINTVLQVTEFDSAQTAD